MRSTRVGNTLIVVARYRRTQPQIYPWVLGVMLGVSAFFLLVMTIAAPPFERCAIGPWAGRCPSLRDYVTVTGATGGAAASRGRSC